MSDSRDEAPADGPDFRSITVPGIGREEFRRGPVGYYLLGMVEDSMIEPVPARGEALAAIDAALADESWRTGVGNIRLYHFALRKARALLDEPVPADEREAQAEAERRWPIHPHGVTDTRDVPNLMRYRSCFVAGATWADSRRQGPITDEVVGVAVDGYELAMREHAKHRLAIRAALEAAEDAR